MTLDDRDGILEESLDDSMELCSLSWSDSSDGNGFFDLLSDSLVEGFFVNVECLGYHDVNRC